MSTAYKVTIAMDDNTVKALDSGGFYLYAFKGVQTTMRGGVPTVWFRSRKISLRTEINWTEDYEAYSSTSEIVPNGQIVASAAYHVDLGQTFEITDDSGIGDVIQDGTTGAISINNETNTQFTSGISQVVGGKASPLCAFPHFGGNLNVMAPVQKVLLMFATNDINTGVVIYKAYSCGGLFNLTGTTSRAVSYDINTGWNWGGGAWGSQIAAKADLVPLLIESSAQLKERVRAAITAPTLA